jgi:hypothetical protein
VALNTINGLSSEFRGDCSFVIKLDILFKKQHLISVLGVVDELDDGKYILLKKTEDNEYSGVRPSKRRPSKKGKKISVVCTEN